MLESFAERVLFGPDDPLSSTWKRERTTECTTQALTPPIPSAKDTYSVTTTPLSTDEDRQTQRRPHPLISRWRRLWHRPQAWRPTLFQVRPLAGFAGLCVAVGCIVGSLGILMVSEGQATDSWPVPPAVCLAIVTAVANSALALAYMEAVPISWWFSITRGRSIRSLEQQWQVTRSLIMAIAHIRHVSLLHIACIAAAFVVIDGPLLQRASTVELATQSTNVTLDLKLWPQLPTGFSGIVHNHFIRSQTEVLHLLYDHITAEPMRLDVHGCAGTVCCTMVAVMSRLQTEGLTVSSVERQSWVPVWRRHSADHEPGLLHPRCFTAWTAGGEAGISTPRTSTVK